MSWHDDLTETYFPSQPPPRVGREDIPARVAAGAAILLLFGAYLLSYKAQIDEVNRDRTNCVRMQRDARVQLMAWEEVSAYGIDVSFQIRRLESILRRDCNKVYPDPALLFN